MPKNLPYMQFYVRDWLGDPDLAKCLLPTRGFWLEALCAMHLSDTPTLEGTPDQLSRALRCSVAEVQSAVSDLKATGAADISERNGSIFITSRRRVKDAHIRELRVSAGSIGGSKASANRLAKLNQNSVSVSASSSDSGNGGEGGKGEPPGFLAFWAAWPKSPRKAGRPQCIEKWEKRGMEANAGEIVAAVEAHKIRHPDWLKPKGEFIPAPVVWLNQERWNAPLPDAPKSEFAEQLAEATRRMHK